jgi:hypothetical protein
VMRDSFGTPVLIEYRFGRGSVVATGQTLEFYYPDRPSVGVILENAIPYQWNQVPIWLSVSPESRDASRRGHRAQCASTPQAWTAGVRRRHRHRKQRPGPAAGDGAGPPPRDRRSDIAVAPGHLEFGSVFVGFPVTRHRHRNDGTDDLHVASLTIDDPAYLLSHTPSICRTRVPDGHDRIGAVHPGSGCDADHRQRRRRRGIVTVPLPACRSSLRTSAVPRLAPSIALALRNRHQHGDGGERGRQRSGLGRAGVAGLGPQSGCDIRSNPGYRASVRIADDASGGLPADVRPAAHHAREPRSAGRGRRSLVSVRQRVGPLQQRNSVRRHRDERASNGRPDALPPRHRRQRSIHVELPADRRRHGPYRGVGGGGRRPRIPRRGLRLELGRHLRRDTSRRHADPAVRPARTSCSCRRIRPWPGWRTRSGAIRRASRDSSRYRPVRW